MIQSMTGFGRTEAENDNYSLTIELKTVNNRYKDFRFKMGSVFNAIEIELKKKLEAKFSRGSFDIYVNYKKSAEQKDVADLDIEKVNAYLQRIKTIADKQGVPLHVQPTEFLRGDFYSEDGNRDEELRELLLANFDGALDNLVVSRAEEGAKLIEKLKEHRVIYGEFLEKVKVQKNDYQEQVKEKLVKRFDTLDNIQVDEPRFLQEVIYYLEKLDIDEELNRIEIHLKKLDKILSSAGDVGRQIDFLVQELNRETNTIGSKSGHQNISECVVQMKVQLEKIREQALNLQ
ncbi:MAG: YicC/YloC family endoribonuclease [Bdellovibrionota bacterium]|nr:YicC/YloC family endoribonuclease [Bdellovibrionota bacterium]